MNSSNQNADAYSDRGLQTSMQDGNGNHNTVTQSMHHATRSTIGRNSQTATQHGHEHNQIDQTITNGDDNVQNAKQEDASNFQARQTTENSANGNTQKIDQDGGTGAGGHASQDISARSGNDQWIGQFHNTGAIAEQTVQGPGPLYQYGGNDQDIVQVGTVNTKAFQTITGGITNNGHQTEDNNQFIAQTGASNFARQNIDRGDTDAQLILQSSHNNTALQSITNSVYSSQKVIQTERRLGSDGVAGLDAVLHSNAEQLRSIFTDISYEHRFEQMGIGTYDATVSYGCVQISRSTFVSIIRAPFSLADRTCDSI